MYHMHNHGHMTVCVQIGPQKGKGFIEPPHAGKKKKKTCLKRLFEHVKYAQTKLHISV